MPRLLSKSKYLAGLQCAKLLWFTWNDSKAIPASDAQAQAIFDQGNQIGELAKQLFPDGVEVEHEGLSLPRTLELTRQALALRRPLFEAAFSFKRGYARPDVLKPVGSDAWDIIEVKSSTSVKDVNLHDIAFQKFVCTGTGLRIRKCFLLHIDSKYVRHGAVDPRQLFHREDVTDAVDELVETVEARLNQMLEVVNLAQHPAVTIGPHCDDPYSCPLHDRCWSFLPEQNVFTLYRGGKKSWNLFNGGVTDIAQVPAAFALTANQDIQRQAAINAEPHINPAALADFLADLKYPISYLDFEAIGTAIPLFDDVRPYQQVPFQFSLHIVRSPGNKPEHRMFLAEGTRDPRPEFMERLQAALPEKGSVVAYNASFEKARLRECAEVLPQFHTSVGRVERRLVDLLVPFRAFHYYQHRQFDACLLEHEVFLAQSAHLDCLPGYIMPCCGHHLVQVVQRALLLMPVRAQLGGGDFWI